VHHQPQGEEQPVPRSERRRGHRLAALRAATLLLTLATTLLLACAPTSAAATGSGRPGSDSSASVRSASTRHPEGSASARLSEGCATSATTATPHRLTVGGLERRLLVTLPDGDRGVPRDLVIAFHGRTNDAARVRSYFDLDEALPYAVIVYPQALPGAPGTFAWRAARDAPSAQRDFALVEAIVDAFAAARCLDLGRVFVVGHSLGAWFANDVACYLGARVRAVASVAGGISGAACSAGTAALLLHHRDDRLVPIAEGERVRAAFLAANGLSATPSAPAEEPELARLRCVRFGDADAPHPVLWCPHDDAISPGGRYDPHTWPAGTAAAIAAFFASLR
jgi:polyhydroxybutyrate depolymerase